MFISYPIFMFDVCFLCIQISNCMSMAFLYFSHELVRTGTESANFQSFNVFIIHLILMHVLFYTNFYGFVCRQYGKLSPGSLKEHNLIFEAVHNTFLIFHALFCFRLSPWIALTPQRFQLKFSLLISE